MLLRHYQSATVDSFFRYFKEREGHPVAALPTGTGKSIIIAAFIREAMRRYPGTRIHATTHVKELITQNFDKLPLLWPSAPAGIYSAGLRKRDIYYPITYSGIGSVYKRAMLFGHTDLLIIDECHLVNTRSMTMYARFINELTEINPKMKVIGLSATPFRTGMGALTDGGLFTDTCIDLTDMASFNRFIKEGYLAKLRTPKTRVAIDTDGLHMRAGEFIAKELDERADDKTTRLALNEALQWSHAENRNNGLIFASSIRHVEAICAQLDALGVEALPVHSKMDAAERDANLARALANNNEQPLFLVNKDVLTTGFDWPGCNIIPMLRPTNSPGLWVQMLGRGTRPHGGKEDCLVLDYARNTERLGPINDPVLPKARRKGKGKGVAPVKVCAACGEYNHATVFACSHCNEEFPVRPKLHAAVSTHEVMVLQQFEEYVPPVKQRVDKVTYSKHTKQGKPDSVRVSYFCGLQRFTEYLCFEHGGLPGKRAREWWTRRHTYGAQVPGKTAEALAMIDTLRTPKHIHVRMNTKYKEIADYDF